MRGMEVVECIEKTNDLMFIWQNMPNLAIIPYYSFKVNVFTPVTCGIDELLPQYVQYQFRPKRIPSHGRDCGHLAVDGVILPL